MSALIVPDQQLFLLGLRVISDRSFDNFDSSLRLGDEFWFSLDGTTYLYKGINHREHDQQFTWHALWALGLSSPIEHVHRALKWLEHDPERYELLSS